MARSLYPSLTTAVTRIFYLHRDLPELTGDYDLSYIELPKRRRGKEYIIRIAAVHLHEASRSRTITISEELLGQMMELAYFYDWEEKLYLSPLEMLFPQPPAFMVTKELGLIQVTRLKEPDQCVVRVTPVTLHLTGPLVPLRIPTGLEDEVFEDFISVKQAPKSPHTCRQLEW